MKKLFINIDKLLLREKLSYVLIWLFIFALPVIGYYYRVSIQADASYEWEQVIRSWKDFLPFLLLFLVHDGLIAPMLVYKDKKVLYLSIMCFALLIFGTYILTQRPFREGPPPHQQMEMFDEQHPQEGPQFADRENQTNQRPPQDDTQHQPSERQHMNHGDNPPPKPNGDMGGPPDNRDLEPPSVMQDKMAKIFFALAMLGANLGIMHYFKQRRREDELKELEHQKLQQELEYLKYQINPHFFMNTLNNIHALVDFDPEKAKSTIIELSRLMRYVLYDSSRPTVLLSKEISFLKQYIALMSLRYTDRVAIEVSMPEDVPGIEVPPLLFISFIENAFKHGVSYERNSFVSIKMQLEDGYLSFSCVNSNLPKEMRKGTKDPHSGIGLENVKKRLKLIYGNDYFFMTTDKDITYEILLKIPVKNDTMLSN